MEKARLENMPKVTRLLMVLVGLAISLQALPGDNWKNGFMTAAYTENAPVIDGQLDDACWKNAVEITPFLVKGTSELAAEQTSAWLAWDDANLYVAYKCMESCLDPLANRRHQFADKLKDNDSKDIWYQDSVVLVLCKDKGPAYEFVVSASGATTDCIMKGEEIWYSRDATWNSGFRPGCRIHDGFWTVEYAVPFSALKETPDGRWRFIIGRVEAPRKENSNWNGCTTGFHDRAQMGELRFGRNLPGVNGIHVPMIDAGDNDIVFHSERPLCFQALLKESGGKESRSTEVSDCKGTVTVQNAGKVEFHWMLGTSKTEAPFAVWPRRICQVRAEKLVFSLENGRVTLNGTEVSSGAVLNNGVNTLSVPVGAKGTFSYGEMTFTTENGWIEKNGVKTRTILLEEPIVFPEWRPEGLTVSENDWMDLNLINRGVKGFQIPDLTFVVDMPEGFTLTGATGMYNVTPITISDGGAAVHDGAPYHRYRIQVMKTVAYNPDIPVWQTIIARFHVPETVTAKEPALYVSEESARLAISMFPVRIPLLITPHPVGARLPDNLRIQLWLGNHLNVADDKSYMDTYREQFERIGITEVPEIFQKKERINQYALITFESWGINNREFLKKHPDKNAVDFDGKTLTDYVCADVILHDAEYHAEFERLIRQYVDRHQHVTHVCWDFEKDVFSSHVGCGCPRCIRAFAAAYPQVPADSTPAVVRKSFRSQWVAFTNQRMAQIAGMLHRELHKNRPDILFSVYTGYQNDYTKESYGVDWSLMKGNIDIAMCGYGRPLKDLEDTRKAIGDTPLVIGLISTPYARSARQRPTAFSEAELMRAFCDSSSGVLFYALMTLDARTFCAVANVSKIIKEYGTFISRHDVSQFANVKPIGIAEKDYSVLQDKDGSLLISFMNLNAARREFKVELPEGYEKTTVQAILDSGRIHVEKISLKKK